MLAAPPHSSPPWHLRARAHYERPWAAQRRPEEPCRAFCSGRARAQAAVAAAGSAPARRGSAARAGRERACRARVDAGVPSARPASAGLPASAGGGTPADQASGTRVQPQIPGAARRDASEREARCDACVCPSLRDHELFFAPFSPSARDETRTRNRGGILRSPLGPRKSPDLSPPSAQGGAWCAAPTLPAAFDRRALLRSPPSIAAVSLSLIDATGLASPDDAGSRVAGTRHAGRRAGRDALTVL